MAVPTTRFTDVRPNVTAKLTIRRPIVSGDEPVTWVMRLADRSNIPPVNAVSCNTLTREQLDIICEIQAECRAYGEAIRCLILQKAPAARIDNMRRLLNYWRMKLDHTWRLLHRKNNI